MEKLINLGIDLKMEYKWLIRGERFGLTEYKNSIR